MVQSISNPQSASPVGHAMDIVAPFSARSLFWRPRYLKPSPILSQVPFLFWLTEMARPSCAVYLAPGEGVGYFALCQAVDKLNLDTRCFAVSGSDAPDAALQAGMVAHNEEFYGDFSFVETQSPGRLRRRLGTGAVDLLVIEAPLDLAMLTELEDDWLPAMAPGGAVVLHGLDGWLASAEGEALLEALQRHGPSVRLGGGQGLLLLLCGDEAPERLKRLAALMPGQQGYGDVHRVFQRLGRALHFEAEYRLAQDKVRQSQIAQEETAQALRAAESKSAQIGLELEELGAELALRTGERDQATADRQASDRHLSALDERHKAVAAELKTALAAAEEKRDWLRGKLSEGENVLKAERAAAEALRQALAEVERDGEMLREKLSGSETARAAQDDRLSEVQTQLETERAAAEALRAERDAARDEIARLEAERDSACGDVARLEAERDAAQARVGETLRVMTERCEALASRAEEFRRDLGEARWQTAQRFEELALLTRLLEQSRAEAQTLEQELHALRGSTSWKMTGPVRRLRRIAGGGTQERGNGGAS